MFDKINTIESVRPTSILKNQKVYNCDHFHILRIVSNKLSLLGSLISSSFSLVHSIDKS